MEAVLFIGIQATGKSTFYKKHFFNSHIRLSLDLLNTRNKLNLFLQTCLDSHSKFVIDNTNPEIKDRLEFIEKAKAKKYKVIGYYFNSSIEASIRRNNLRKGKAKIPDIGIKGCHKKLQQPSYKEGFDALYYVSIKDNEFIISEWNNEI